MKKMILIEVSYFGTHCRRSSKPISPSIASWAVLQQGIHHIRVSQSETGLLNRVLLHQQRLPLSRDTAYWLLQECIKRKDLVAGRHLHSLMVWSELDSIASLGDHLIRFFGLNGHLSEANLAFCRILQRSVYTWEAIISAHTSLGESEKALELYDRMRDDRVRPGKFVFLGILRACGNIEAIHKGRLIHVEIVKDRLEADLIVESTLLNMYAQCGGLEDARKVFDDWSSNDVVMWNTMISGYSQHGHGLAALELFEKMELKGLKPDKVTYLGLLKACVIVGSVSKGWFVHDEIIRSSNDSDLVIGNTLVDMYAKCGELDESERVFAMLSWKNVVTWNAIIAGHVQHGHSFTALELFKKMQQQGIRPDKVTFLSVLEACGTTAAIGKGQLIHDEVVRCGLSSDVSVGNALIHMYATGGNVELARKVFDSLSGRDMVSWGAMISGYSQHGYDLLAFELFEDMQLKGIKPEKVVLLCLLKACGNMGAIREGLLVHHQIIEQGLEFDVAVGSTLTDMYAKCENLDEARDVFEKLHNRDVVSWSAMIAGLAQHGHGSLAFELFERMQQEGIKPDRVTYLCLLKACGNIKAIRQGKWIHRQMIGNGFELDVVVGSTLVDMYVKFGDMEEACQVFDKMVARNEVSWSAMIAGYIQHGQSLLALELFQKMREEGFTPDKVMMLGILKASGSVGAVGPGMAVHDQIIRSGVGLDPIVGNTLVDMYAKCGRVDEAHKVFDKLPNQDVVSWSAMIAAHAQQGNYRLVWQALEDMKQQGIKPVDSTYTSILAACCHAGRVEDGHQHFKSMTEDYGIAPTVEHFNCMIDLLGRAAHFDEAKQLLQTMPIPPDVTSWMSLLTACRSYRKIELGRLCFNEVVRLDSNVAAAYVLMSNIYADANMWEDVHKLRLLRQCTRAWKKPGVAWMESQNKLHEFMVSDKNHPEGDHIYAKVNRLKGLVREGGYVPIPSLVSELSLDEDEEVALVRHHRVVPIRNEMCTDHDKHDEIMSKIEKREILFCDSCLSYQFASSVCYFHDLYVMRNLLGTKVM